MWKWTWDNLAQKDDALKYSDTASELEIPNFLSGHQLTDIWVDIPHFFYCELSCYKYRGTDTSLVCNFISFWQVLRSEMAGFYGRSRFRFLRNLHMGLLCGYTSNLPTNSGIQCLFPLILVSICYFLNFWMIATLTCVW